MISNPQSSIVNRQSRRRPLPGVLLPLTLPLSWAYGRVIAARNRRFDRGEGITRFDVPAISVGNITTGGTGKTPMVAWIARLLREHGVQPVIAMRGYKARPSQPSDEEAEYHELLPGIHVLANPDRVSALREFLPQHPQVKCIILDDGFQHRQIHRDLDLVLIDASAATYQDRLLPAGNLREPLVNLRRADAIVVTHADADILESEISNLRSQIERFHGRPTLASSRHRWTRLDVYHGENVRFSRGNNWLHGKRVATMLGIGNPASVLRQLEAIGATVVTDVPALDHQQYDADSLDVVERVMEYEDDETAAKEALAHIQPRAEALVVTGKDWVKLRSLIDWSSWPVPIVVPRLEIDVFEGEAALRERVRAVVQSPTATKAAR